MPPRKKKAEPEASASEAPLETKPAEPEAPAPEPEPEEDSEKIPEFDVKVSNGIVAVKRFGWIGDDALRFPIYLTQELLNALKKIEE